MRTTADFAWLAYKRLQQLEATEPKVDAEPTVESSGESLAVRTSNPGWDEGRVKGMGCDGKAHAIKSYTV